MVLLCILEDEDKVFKKKSHKSFSADSYNDDGYCIASLYSVFSEVLDGIINQKEINAMNEFPWRKKVIPHVWGQPNVF